MIKKYYLSILFFLILLSCSDATFNTEDRRVNFEKYLESFINGPIGEVLYEFGTPAAYENPSDNKGGIMVDYMIYKNQYTFAGKSYICNIRFKIQRKKNKVLEYDYNGDGCF